MRALLIAFLVTACGGSVDSTGTSDGGTDSATESDSSTTATDTSTPTTETGGCSGPAPGTMCFDGGGPGRACADVAKSMVCTDGKWACPAGTNSTCGCMAGAPGPGSLPLKPGDMCPDADSGTPPDSGTCDCIATKLAWNWDGGFVAYVDRSDISPCRNYTRTREASGSITKTCSKEMLKCGAGDAIDMGDVQAALANADVVAAFKSAPVLYGRDSRPVDGQVFRINYGGKVVDIGDDCGAISACKPIPEGLKKLKTLLQAIDMSCTGM
jgi:hypothetical protein